MQVFVTILHDMIVLVTSKAMLYRFQRGVWTYAARRDHLLALADQGVELLATVFTSLGDQVRPRNARVAATLCIKIVMNAAFMAASDHPDLVESGEFQRELTAMIARYLFGDGRLPLFE